MNLPAEFPDDVDYDWYEKNSRKILVDIGYLSPENKEDDSDEELDENDLPE
jgi:hypothetical protein